MQFGVEIDTRCGIYGLYAVLFKIFYELVVNQLNALAYRRCIVARLNGLKRALEIVDYRKQTLQSIFAAILYQLALLLECALAEVVKLCHKEQILLLLLFKLRPSLVKLLLKSVNLVHLLIGNILCGLGLLLLDKLIINIIDRDFVVSYMLRFSYIVVILILVHIFSLFSFHRISYLSLQKQCRISIYS